MVADFNNEKETIKEYNGRQILELLQNADDEESEDVFIELNTNKKTLIVSNSGHNCKPFSEGGIKSLMLPNFSPKKEKKYIGNKGLGFRSIVNWSEQITIYSQDLKILFSYETAKEVYGNRTQGKIAFLSLPKIQEYKNNSWTTSIEIHYKDEHLEDIEQQLRNIKNEVLLFVNNINKLTININGELNKIEQIKDNNKINLNNIPWKIFEYDKYKNILPEKYWENDEEEYFDLKIAINESFDNSDNLLYSFFPTEISIDFPFIIHGTFELDSPRNNINISKKNMYILEKLVEFIVDTAKELIKDNVSYKALEFLKHKNSNHRLETLNFYTNIDNSIDILEIFPCIDNKYRKKDEVIFISSDFSNFIEKTNNQQLFPNMLKSPLNANISLINYNIVNDINDYSIINKLSKIIDNIEDRIELISLISKNFGNNNFELLIDENEKIIKKDDETYTPITKDYNFHIPSFVKVKFINSNLYRKLLQKFDINSNEKSRDLQRELKGITNIKSYEPAQILQKIITSTNKELNNQTDKISIVQEMILSLYENYKILGEQTKIPENIQVQLISKENTIESAKKLFLSKTYPSGELTEDLFGNIFNNNLFLADITLFAFEENEDKEQIKSFFLWLGINEISKTIISPSDEKNRYCDTYFDSIDGKPDYADHMTLSNAYGIYNLNSILKTISPEKFIVWCIKDKNIYNSFNGNELVTLRGPKGGRINEKYCDISFLHYTILSSNVFKDYLITNDKLSRIVNSVSIDFDNSIFKKYKVSKVDIESLILKIGAVDKFSDLSTGAIKNILKKLPEKSSDGKQTQTIYKECIEHYKKNKKQLDDNTILLFAKKDNERTFYNQNEIYYNGNIKLPKSIINTKAILNFPRRGRTKDVVDFFGIKDLEVVSIITKKYKKSKSNDAFQHFFTTIIPFILVYRFEKSITEASREKDTASIINININLCNKVEYSVNDKMMELENNDYINENKNYLIKVDSDEYFDDLRKNLDFREVFADIIGTIFDINDMDKFSRLISDSINETEEIIKRNVGVELLYDAREYLNISDEIHSFWSVIYALKNKEYLYVSEKNPLQNIKNELNITTSINKIDYKDLQKNDSCKNIQALFKELEITIIDFNNRDPYYRIDFTEFHNKNLKNSFHSYLNIFKQSLYIYCKESNQQQEFLSIKGHYEHNKLTINSNELNIDYDNKVLEFIKNNFEFPLEDKISEEIDFEGIYSKNKEEIDFEKIEHLNKYRSLLYFDNEIDDIKKYINKENNKKEKEKSNNGKTKVVKSIVPVNLLKPIEQKENQSISNNPYKHSQNKNKSNKQTGDNAERDVFNSLINGYGKENVEWVSNDDDKLRYDLRYKNNNVWKYVEVKAYSNEKFYLSKTEKEFAERYIENYEIFLVGNEIYKISNIDFTKLNMVASKYEVLYQIKRNKI